MMPHENIHNPQEKDPKEYEHQIVVKRVIWNEKPYYRTQSGKLYDFGTHRLVGRMATGKAPVFDSSDDDDDDDDDDSEIVVKRFIWNGTLYYRTQSGKLYDFGTHRLVGRMANNGKDPVFDSPAAVVEEVE